jgi:cytochrome c-type biogenesis protein CcmH
VVDLRPRDAQALVDYADALAVINNRTLDGEPEKLVMQAVKLDPANLKALSLAGTVSFNHADYAAAVLYWQKAIDISQPDGELARQLQGAVAEARQRGNLPAPAQLATGPVMAAASASISGRISLAPALKAKVAPGDTLFVYARPATGSRMPLAILRKQVSDLPLNFTLDDSQAMSPASRLSSVQQVVVGARISKSGNAMPQPGDLEVLSNTVPVGTKALQLEIADTVR